MFAALPLCNLIKTYCTLKLYKVVTCLSGISSVLNHQIVPTTAQHLLLTHRLAKLFLHLCDKQNITSFKNMTPHITKKNETKLNSDEFTQLSTQKLDKNANSCLLSKNTSWHLDRNLDKPINKTMLEHQVSPLFCQSGKTAALSENS